MALGVSLCRMAAEELRILMGARILMGGFGEQREPDRIHPMEVFPNEHHLHLYI